MILIWRKYATDRESAGEHDGSRRSGRGRSLLLGLTLMVGLPGCAWVRAQAQHRSDECQELCSQADEAQDSGRPDQAERLLKRALRKSPRDLEVRRQLADSLWNLGRQREAIDQLSRLADEHPQDVRLAVTLAHWLTEAEQYDLALDRLQPALLTEPVCSRALELKAQIEAAQGEDEQALITYQRLSQQEASQAEALIQMGAIYLRRGQPDRAAPLFRTVLAHPRATMAQQASAGWRLGVAYAQSERWNDAANQFAAAASQREMSADDWHAAAYAHYRAGQLAEAQSSLSAAFELDPRHVAGQKLAGVILHAESQRGTASEALLPAGFERVQDSARHLPR